MCVSALRAFFDVAVLANLDDQPVVAYIREVRPVSPSDPVDAESRCSKKEHEAAKNRV
jgi:hypothetical protein